VTSRSGRSKVGIASAGDRITLNVGADAVKKLERG
jgi:tRNA threonylcarbamoyladenosine modification (KEOPS) complex  Pcc1 subunit